jgi:hypothetical protein
LHISKKHPNNIIVDEPANNPVFNTEILFSLLKKVSCKIIESSIYGDKIIEVVKKFQIDQIKDEIQFDRIIETCSKISLKSLNEFYADYFGRIVINSRQIFNCDAEYEDTATLLLSKLADSIASYYRANISSVSDKKISSRQTVCEREKYGLQYLGGYCIHKLKKKIQSFRTNNDTAIQQAISILKSCQSETKNIPDQKLINALSRGGLTGITIEFEQILVIAEKAFCLYTEQSELTKSIDIDFLTEKTLYDQDIDEYYRVILESCDLKIEKDIQKSTLCSILRLYFRVRSHSFVKDIVNEHKAKKTNRRTT